MLRTGLYGKRSSPHELGRRKARCAECVPRWAALGMALQVRACLRAVYKTASLLPIPGLVSGPEMACLAGIGGCPVVACCCQGGRDLMAGSWRESRVALVAAALALLAGVPAVLAAAGVRNGWVLGGAAAVAAVVVVVFEAVWQDRYKRLAQLTSRNNLASSCAIWGGWKRPNNQIGHVAKHVYAQYVPKSVSSSALRLVSVSLRRPIVGRRSTVRFRKGARQRPIPITGRAVSHAGAAAKCSSVLGAELVAEAAR
jgi:hypothetical protein